MFYCAHDPGLALLLAEEDGRLPEPATPPATVRAIMILILTLNAAALLMIALA